jgi:WD40 repeat protein
MICLISCGQSGGPTTQPAQIRRVQTFAWTGHPGALTESGAASGFVFGVLHQSGNHQYFLTKWHWEGGMLREQELVRLPKSIDTVPLQGRMCGLSLDPGNAHAPWPYVLIDVESQEVLARWSLPKGWYTVTAGGSRNGRFVALVARDWDAEGSDFRRDRIRVALINVEKKSLGWVGELTGRGAGTIRTIAVTPDGRYVAVAGWDNGTALFDTQAEKVLWAKRPEGEISTGYAAFAPDGEHLFTIGGSACVYEIEVTTGKVVGQRWATPTGEKIYGYRASALGVSDDGKWLAAGTRPEGDVYVWRLDSGGPATTLQAGGGVEIVSFSPDSQRLVTVGGGSLRVWDLGPGEQAAERRRK